MLVTFATEGDMDRWLELDEQRWDVYSDDLGVSLHAMQQLGHWQPFTSQERYMFSEMMELAVEFSPEWSSREHQQSRRVGPPSQEHSNVDRRLW